MNHFLNMGPGGGEGLIAGRVSEVMHHFLKPKILKADFSNEMNGLL